MLILMAAALAQPQAVHDFCRDIAVLAMPVPAGQARIKDVEGKASLRYNQ
ncbi:MAG: hypothetical protein IT427_07575 [Pirellulales bacterium]|nr:hypothetical protein [Pirellulales bacterium]